MSKHFRITAYNEKENISVILDSNGKFEKLWEFSLYMREKGFTVVEIDASDRFINGNISVPKTDSDCVILRACQYGKPIETTYTENGFTYRAVQVDKKIYVPDRNVRK